MIETLQSHRAKRRRRQRRSQRVFKALIGFIFNEPRLPFSWQPAGSLFAFQRSPFNAFLLTLCRVERVPTLQRKAPKSPRGGLGRVAIERRPSHVRRQTRESRPYNFYLTFYVSS